LINIEELEGYDPKEDQITFETKNLRKVIGNIIEQLSIAKAPVIYAGTGIRLSGQYDNFLKLIEHLKIPVVTAWNSNDLLPDDHPCYAGRPGSVGNRAGNFTVQNADFVLVLGCRLNIRLISYNWENFAKQARIAMIDIDTAELKKPTLKIDVPVHADLREALPLLLEASQRWKPHHEQWLDWCRERLEFYPPVTSKMKEDHNNVNPYYFMKQLFQQLESHEVIACGDGTACVIAFQAAIIKNGQRLFHNSGCASMGYDLPAAIGAGIALPDRKRLICLAGDGSIMMNLQELQTIVHHKLPVKIFILNNRGYHSIRQTQGNFFADNIVGCGTESGLSFPDFKKVAAAFEMSYQRVEDHASVPKIIAEALAHPRASITEVVLNLDQAFEPKLSSRKLEDGTMVTANLEDMAPFLSREELEKNRFLHS